MANGPQRYPKIQERAKGADRRGSINIRGMQKIMAMNAALPWGLSQNRTLNRVIRLIGTTVAAAVHHPVAASPMVN